MFRSLTYSEADGPMAQKKSIAFVTKYKFSTRSNALTVMAISLSGRKQKTKCRIKKYINSDMFVK